MNIYYHELSNIDNNYKSKLSLPQHRIPSIRIIKIFHRIHVWYIYLHLVDFYDLYVGKYTSPMDPMALIPTKRCMFCQVFRTKPRFGTQLSKILHIQEAWAQRFVVDLFPRGSLCRIQLQPSKMTRWWQLTYFFPFHPDTWVNDPI